MVKCKNCKHLKNDSSIEKKICFLIGEIGNPDEEISCACYRPATNADRIRSMTDEELAELLGTRLDVTSLCENLEDGCWYKCQTHECDYNDEKLILKWLKSEVGCE